MFVVDTNILLHAVNKSSPHHADAVRLLKEWRRAGFHLTWGIAYEFLRVATHRAVFPEPLSFSQAWAFLGMLVRGRVEMLLETENHVDLLLVATKELPQLAGSKFHDLHTALLMREHGVPEIKTMDTDFHGFPWLRAENPLLSSAQE